MYFCEGPAIFWRWNYISSKHIYALKPPKSPPLQFYWSWLLDALRIFKMQLGSSCTSPAELQTESKITGADFLLRNKSSKKWFFNNKTRLKNHLKKKTLAAFVNDQIVQRMCHRKYCINWKPKKSVHGQIEYYLVQSWKQMMEKQYKSKIRSRFFLVELTDKWDKPLLLVSHALIPWQRFLR